MIRNEVGYRLQTLMENKGMTFTELSKKSGVSRDHIYHLVDGSKEMGIDTIEKLAVALGIQPKSLLDFASFEKNSKEDVAILKAFNELPDNYWDFATSSTDDLIHGLHNYPAVMIFPISRTIIKIVDSYKPIHSLMDPFVGSGTVAVEAQLKGIKKIVGNDLNPLALLISKAKTTLLTEVDFNCCKKIEDTLVKIQDEKKDLIDRFSSFICEKYSIVEKGDWSSKADEITNDYFKDTALGSYKIPKIENLGFWFRPEVIIEIEIIKSLIDKFSTENCKSFLYCALSEVIRFTSNTRNSEFKLYRKPVNKILEKKQEPILKFITVLNTNLKKEKEYLKFASKDSKVSIICNNAQNLKDVKDDSIDVVITSPPYGDSHTTVAYGQFSRLSNVWLGLSNEKNLDSLLLGGKKVLNKKIESLGSKTLIRIYNKIASIDEKRAREVLDFYFDLDVSLKEITSKVMPSGYEFWVVGNRTVKKINIPTDIILGELGEKYKLKVLKRFYRHISNKVMPSVNSPTNKVGDHVQTMTSEIIVFFKKII